MLEKTLESLLDCKEIQPVHSKGDQPWVFFGRTDAEAETPILWPPHVKSWFIGKDPDAGRDCGQEEKGTTEDKTAEWHHRLDGHEFEWTLGVGDGRGGLACCNSWGRRESDMTEWLNWTELLYGRHCSKHTHTHTHPILNQSSDFEPLNPKSYKHFRMISFYKPQSPMSLWWEETLFSPFAIHFQFSSTQVR